MSIARSSAQASRYRPYVAVAVVLFFVQALYEAALLFATTGAENPTQLLEVISTWQAPLRDLQIHGFALLMILGASSRSTSRSGSAWT